MWLIVRRDKAKVPTLTCTHGYAHTGRHNNSFVCFAKVLARLTNVIAEVILSLEFFLMFVDIGIFFICAFVYLSVSHYLFALYSC